MMSEIGLLTYAHDRPAGGIGRYTQELSRALRSNEACPLILRAGSNGRDQDSVPLPGARLLPALLTLGQAEIAWQARRHRLKLIHDPTGTMPLALAGSKKVSTIHDVIPFIFPETSTLLDRLIYRCWLPLATRRLDAVITVSRQSKVDIVRCLKLEEDKVTVIPIAAGRQFRVLEEAEVAPDLARYGVERPYILYVGSVEARKNLIRLLEAYAQLRRWSSRWTLVIVGASSPKAERVHATVKRLNLSGAVHFPGYVADEDLPAIYNGADLLVFPSLYEGFGLPVLEAMACGTPVVTSNVSSLPEVAGEAALLVNPHNVEEIAGAMRRALEDADLAQALRQRGLDRARLFRWERTARETVEVYRRVLGAA
jgi:glycosyltransferase involved in cell wall biosynthesis